MAEDCADVPERSAPGTAGYHFKLESGAKYEHRLDLANAIAEQIWREQQLVSTRMGWNFTLQGFLVGIYVFAGSGLAPIVALVVRLVLAYAGFMVARHISHAVSAAHSQSSRHKQHWFNEFTGEGRPAEFDQCDLRAGAFPQPFSQAEGSQQGRSASIKICELLQQVWVALALIALGAVVLPILFKGDLFSAGRTVECVLNGSNVNVAKLSCVLK